MTIVAQVTPPSNARRSTSMLHLRWFQVLTISCWQCLFAACGTVAFPVMYALITWNMHVASSCVLQRCMISSRSWAPLDSSQPSILHKIGQLRPKFPERCPLSCPRIPNLVRIGCGLLDLFWKDWFFGPKKPVHYTLSAYNKEKYHTLSSKAGMWCTILTKLGRW